MMFIKTSPLSFEYVVSALNVIPEVTNLYSTTGEFHLTCKVITQNNTKLYDIIQRISKIKGIESINYQTITKILKDNQDISIEKQASMKINCDYCNNPIHASSLKILNTNSFEKFFCCSSCITLYQEKNNLFVK